MKLNQLKEILKEVVRDVVREEVRSALREEINSTPQPLKNMNIPKKLVKPTGDPIQDILNETAQNSDWRTMGYYTAMDAQTFNPGINNFNNEPNVTTIQDFTTQNVNHPNTPLHQVRVDSVPDFSKMMGVMKNKGML